MKHAGIHFPENAGGEHPDRETIADMPGMAGATLICSPSGRYHYDFLRKRNPSAIVVWRAIPREAERKLPAQLGWDAKRVADECLNLWDEQPHYGTEWFLPLNELQFERENGGPFPGYGVMADNLRLLRLELRRRLPGVKLLFPAWVPMDDGDRLDDWRLEASAWDAICLHAYGSAEAMRARYDSYRSAFPHHPIFVGEWNSNHEGHDERASLQMWAEVADTDPLFLGATYYIWETLNHGERDLSIWGNGARYGLFLNPPVVTPKPETPTMTRDEVVALIVQKAGEFGLVPWEFLGGAIAESALDPTARRPRDPSQDQAYWPDVSFGLFQQTARWADEGDQSMRGDNIRYIQDLYFDPVHACDVAARKFKAYRAQEATALDAWCRYNWPAKAPAENPNRGNYANGLDEAKRLVGTPMTVSYNPSTPPILQDDPWSCAPTALRWALTSLGRNPGPTYIEDLLVRDGVVSKDQGLLDASGAGLAAWIGKREPADVYYGADGFYGNSEPSVTYNGVALEGDHAYPILIGGRAWNHWTGVRGYDAARNVLLLANPSPGWMNVEQEMTPEQFAALGPFSMVRVLHPDLPGVGQPPVIDPDPPIITPADTRMARARELLVQAMAILDEPAPA